MNTLAVRLKDIDPFCDYVLSLVNPLLRTYLDEHPKASCHDVCEHLAGRLPALVEHVRGHFYMVGWPHSWLRLKHKPLAIIDAYPWASGGPLMVTTEGMSPWRYLYIEKEENDAPAAATLGD